jgi:hypothetical protein
MEPEGSLPCSQELAAGSYISWARCIQFTTSHPISLRSILILSLHLRLGLPSGYFPSGFPTKILYTSMGVRGLNSQRGLRIILFSTASRPALEPTQPPIQWKPEALSLGVKRPGSEANHSPPPSAEVKEWVELYLHSHNTPSWRGAQLKHRDNFTFTFVYTEGRRKEYLQHIESHTG